MAMAPEQTGIGIRRHFTTEGIDPYDDVVWERRDARITNFRDGSVAFEQRDVEFPVSWSQNATNIVAQKYFRGSLGSPERERSLRQVIDRVADTITAWGRTDGYFVDDQEAEAFRAELKHLVSHQKAAFNSPVWFNIGVAGEPQQASACQPWHAPVSTPEGLVPIGALVEERAVGAKVFDAHGLTSVVAVKANGRKVVLRLHTVAGYTLDVTADHLVWRADGSGDRPGSGAFVPAGQVRRGDELEWHQTECWGDGQITRQGVAEAALAGWIQAGGYVVDVGGKGVAGGEVSIAGEADERWLRDALEAALPGVRANERARGGSAGSAGSPGSGGARRRLRLEGKGLAAFVKRWGLDRQGPDAAVPESLFSAPLPVAAAYLRSLFQAEGWLSSTGAIVGLAMTPVALVRGVQSLLLRFGVFTRVRRVAERRVGGNDFWVLNVTVATDGRRFADEIGFVDPARATALEAACTRLAAGVSTSPRLVEVDSVEVLGEMPVYDIQTESGEYLSGNLRVHNCFILAVEDTMRSILNWYVEEGIIFQGGSGAGVNLSGVRSSYESLKGGGLASGPVSFMRGADASAGTIKSGGKTRRAAKMVILNADHPDIEDFIRCKAVEERKARVLRDAGFDMDLDGRDSHSTQYQNANNSVRVTDEFMQAVLDDRDWPLRAVTTGDTLRTLRARDLFRHIAEAAWECADPGMQFDTTINRWHTASKTGRINASNPCFPGDQLVHTDKGLIRFDELFDRARRGEAFGVYTHDATNLDSPSQRVEVTRPEAFMLTGWNEIVRLRFDNGMELRCTPNHALFTLNRGWVPASELTSDDHMKILDLPAPATNADLRIPVSTDVADYEVEGDWSRSIRLPEKWTPEFAHYLGWLVGDGCVAGDVVTSVYGGGDDKEHVLPKHVALLEWMNGGRPPKPSMQANGTVQLRQSRRVIARFLDALGVGHAKADDKTVPWAIEQAPPEAAAAFLRGLFDADGCVYDGSTNRYVGVASSSRPLLQGVQRVLATFGIASRIYPTRRASEEALTHVRKDGSEGHYAAKQLYDLRISSRSIQQFADHIGFGLPGKANKLAALLAGHRLRDVCPHARLVERTHDGVELTYNLSEPRNHSYVVQGITVRNCSEYMHLDNSACNLASLNLMKFLRDDDTFDVEAFKQAVEVVFTAQEILVGNADYPTEKIAETSRRFRQLGLGYANLGALLMACGMPYDSEEGRAWAGAITALMTGHAYVTSARIASRMGPFAGYTENAEPTNRVLQMHHDASLQIDDDLVPIDLLSSAQESWEAAVELCDWFGVRNAQSTVLAPTGTIGLMMDCDTTGIEPDLGLCKTKKLVGGGTMSIVNQTVPRALRRLEYSPEQVTDIIAYIDEHKSILGAPHLSAAHLPVFACSMGDNTIHYLGHVKMMGAVQPFISGAISKCIVGETLVTSSDGLVRIGSLHDGEAPDTFRHEVREVASLGGEQKTDAFYYGGVRPVWQVVLRSGHRVAGTQNHRLLVTGPSGLDWRQLDEIERGDFVATQYGAELWSMLPARFDTFVPSAPYGSQRSVQVPEEMSEELAFLLGAYAAEGHTSRATWTVVITNSEQVVLDRVAAAWQSLFGVDARILRQAGKCPAVAVASKTIVEFLEHLGGGARASAKRIPDAVLQSPRTMVLAFLQGLALDAYTTVATAPKWGLCLDSPGLLDDLQAVLTNLGIVHGRLRKLNRANGKTYDEVYVAGEQAQDLVALVPFLEPDKRERAERLLALRFTARNTADVVPGVSPFELYRLLPQGTGVRTEFAYLCDPRTVHVTRRSLERVASVPGVVLPAWLRSVLDDGLHFSPVASVGYAGEREVFDLSVPKRHAFVGNGIVNHNTINMPEEATIDDVEQLHIDAWKLGLKAVAIYRDNCKVAQPLSSTKKDVKANALTAPAERLTSTLVVREPVREKLPRRRNSKTFSFRVADCHGYVTVGEYDDGHPGEIFLRVAKQGSTLAGIMDAFAISVSHGLQYGVPLKAFVEMYTNMRFEPAGMTDDPDIRFASSLVDYIFRRLAVEYLSLEERSELGILTIGERMQPTLPGVEEYTTPTSTGTDVVPDPARAVAPVPAPAPAVAASAPVAAASDAPYCYQCGMVMQRAGACFVCSTCGTTSGCS